MGDDYASQLKELLNQDKLLIWTTSADQLALNPKCNPKC